jgi:LmbE family N-acetylglucosaminyl deacetylase
VTAKFQNPTAEVFVPDGQDTQKALGRTTHLGIVAHADDLEILAVEGILSCFGDDDRWFTGVVVSDGAGSPRHKEYKRYTDAQMREVRRREQRKAAYVGEYSACVLLDHPRERVLPGPGDEVVSDLVSAIESTKPGVIYTHNLTDAHDTHVAVALRVIRACRTVRAEGRPQRVIGCEVWRDLDWLCKDDKVRMNVDRRQNLQNALLGVFDSQITGGKRYDRGAMGRRAAHATYGESHATDNAEGVVYGVDMTPLVAHPNLDPGKYAQDLIRNFEAEVLLRIQRLG